VNDTVAGCYICGHYFVLCIAILDDDLAKFVLEDLKLNSGSCGDLHWGCANISACNLGLK
jgi:hypothetical protein